MKRAVGAPNKLPVYPSFYGRRPDRFALVLAGLRKRAGLQWLIVALLSLQLLTGLHHQHTANKVAPDCAACTLAVQWSGGAPPANPPVVAEAISIPCPAVARPVAILGTALPPHVLPFSQAPPAVV